MKRLVILMCALVTFSLSAQQGARHERGNHRKGMMKELSPEEAANLKTKKMTLDLDLTEAQQDEIYQIHLKNARDKKTRIEELEKRRDAGESKRPTKEEQYERISERLDKQIAHKKQMKRILNKDQYEKWERHAMHKGQMKNKERHMRSHRSRK